LRVIYFLSDGAAVYRTDSYTGASNIANRNTAIGVGDDSLQNLVNDTVNDVAMTVLPNAPIDPATGLPVPTIAVATAGGVSVIKDDGTVVDSSSMICFFFNFLFERLLPICA
jgi:trimeric autotransporter adhesin